MAPKKESRIIGIDDASFDRGRDSHAKVVGVIYRGGNFLDGLVSCTVKIDGNDSTLKIAQMINRSKFKPQARCIFLKGLAVAGFNVIDINALSRKTGIPVIVIMRRLPRAREMKSALAKLRMEHKIPLIEKAGRIFSLGKLHYQFSGLPQRNAEEFIRLSISHAQIPEALRVAHLIAGGIATGESKGHA